MWQKSSSSNMKDLDDLQLLEAVLQRRNRAFEEFLRRFKGLMYSCIQKVFMKHAIPYTDDSVSDVLSQVYFNLVKDDFHKLRVYDPEKGYKVASWLCLIATNTTYDELRRKPKYLLTLDDPDDYREPVTDILSPMEESVLRERLDIMAQAVELLTDRERDFLHLYYMEGLEPEEIAERMGISTSTVYSKKNKLVAKLAKLIKGMLEEQR